MSDGVGALLALLAIVVPLVIAWWLLARRSRPASKRRGKIPP